MPAEAEHSAQRVLFGKFTITQAVAEIAHTQVCHTFEARHLPLPRATELFSKKSLLKFLSANFLV
jgi:hypothetical protein